MTTINGRACVANGRNLLTGTSNELKSGTVPAGKNDSGQEATNGFQYAVNAGETYTYQVYVGKENPVDAYVIIGSYDENKNWYDIIGQGNTVLANTGGVSEVTFTIPNEVRYINLTPLGFSAQSIDITVYWKEEKLEKGSVATPRSPAPVDKVFSNGNQVYGRNLLLDSQTQMRDPSWFNKNLDWNKDWGTYLGGNIRRTSNSWDNDRYSYKDLLDRGVINTTDDFTYSIYFRVVGEDPAGMSHTHINFFSNATTKDNQTVLSLNSLKDGQWTRIVVPIKFTGAEYQPDHIYAQSIRAEVSEVPKVAGAHYEFAAPKLEKGTTATPYSIAPEDVM